MKITKTEILMFFLVNTLSIGKPEKGKMVEDIIIGMAQRGQIGGKMGEKELINILEMVNERTQKTTTVKVNKLKKKS